MRVDERFGDAEFGGDVVQRGAGEAALVEEFDCLLEDPLALVGQNFISHSPVIHSGTGWIERLPASSLEHSEPRRETMAGLLEGKSALITGGGGGIGRATALIFAREGARLAVADAVPRRRAETVAQVNKARRAGDRSVGRRHGHGRGAGDG